MTLDIINKIADHEPQPFIAPIPTRNTKKVFTVQDDIPYWFDIDRNIDPGWWLLDPNKDKKTVSPFSTFTPTSVDIWNAVSGCPKFNLLALFPLSLTQWLTIPYNFSDAEQRGWLNGMPKTVYLVHENIKPLDIIVTHKINSFLVFHEVSSIPIWRSKERLIAQDIIGARIRRLQEMDEKFAEEQKIKTQKENIEASLNFYGAQLVDWTREIDGYSVTWSHKGHEHTMKIDTNLRIRSAGVCLGNTDNMHSLSSVVAVMQHRQREIDSGRHGDW